MNGHGSHVASIVASADILYAEIAPDVDITVLKVFDEATAGLLMYFTEAFWPDFDRGEFHRALQVFQKRDRRFGNAKDIVVGIQEAAKEPALTA